MLLLLLKSRMDLIFARLAIACLKIYACAQLFALFQKLIISIQEQVATEKLK